MCLGGSKISMVGSCGVMEESCLLGGYVKFQTMAEITYTQTDKNTKHIVFSLGY